MTGPFATRIFRITFFLAGCYNLAFGLWAGFFPLRFFELFDIPPPRYPEIWACLGMVVGVYGLLYWQAAWKLENGWAIIAVGLLGKVLGPIGMVMSVSQQWPLRLAMLNVFNDAIWWLPFSLFLIRGTMFADFRALASRGYAPLFMRPPPQAFCCFCSLESPRSPTWRCVPPTSPNIRSLGGPAGFCGCLRPKVSCCFMPGGVAGSIILSRRQLPY